MIRTIKHKKGKATPLSSKTVEAGVAPSALSKELRFNQALYNPIIVQRELNNRSLYEFFKYFWDEISAEPLVENWHLKYICDEIQIVLERVAEGSPKLYDLIINVPPGTSKTTMVSIIAPAWAWSKWYWMKFITSGYNADLALESAEQCRDLIKSEKFMEMYPALEIKKAKDAKSNFKVVKKVYINKGHAPRLLSGGSRLSTSVGGTLVGFHGHVLISDDPLKPISGNSVKQIQTANNWFDHQLATRKVDKLVSVTIIVMQRLHQNDPSGHLLKKSGKNIKHICLPGELGEYEEDLKPQSLKKYYVDGLLDPIRLSRPILKELKADLGQYGYAGQIGQRPTPPGGGMFKVDNFSISHRMPLPHEIEEMVRFWDKAGTKDGGAFTAGVKIAKLKTTGKFLVLDVVRGQWSADKRERVIRKTAEADGINCDQWIEQEPGSGGLESAESTIKSLAGYNIYKERPVGDKVYRADPLSVQVNEGNVELLYGDWNSLFIDEFRHFPLSEYKDQVDATAAGFAKIATKRTVRSW